MAGITKDQAYTLIDMQLEELGALKRSLTIEMLDAEAEGAKKNPSPNGMDTPILERIDGIEARYAELADAVDRTTPAELRETVTVAGFVKMIRSQIPEKEFRLSDSLRRVFPELPKEYWDIKKDNLLFESKICHPDMTKKQIDAEFTVLATKKMKR